MSDDESLDDAVVPTTEDQLLEQSGQQVIPDEPEG